ncbi:MAG: type II toxin-antitoxin system VapC family toxin [Candidatus Eremiobacterota bacterium]
MNLLLDTHIFLWWILDDPHLGPLSRGLLADGSNSLFWSAASSWEVGIKYALGRLPLPDRPSLFLAAQLSLNRVHPLPVRDDHAFKAAALPPLHRDPFDRMLVAQAQTELLTLVSLDEQVRQYDVPVLGD